MTTDHRADSLRTMRGLMYGIAISAAIWLAVVVFCLA